MSASPRRAMPPFGTPECANWRGSAVPCRTRSQKRPVEVDRRNTHRTQATAARGCGVLPNHRQGALKSKAGCIRWILFTNMRAPPRCFMCICISPRRPELSVFHVEHSAMRTIDALHLALITIVVRCFLWPLPASGAFVAQSRFAVHGRACFGCFT